jgi:hypothetical protein
MLRVSLAPTRSAFQPRCDLEVRVTLRNEGAAPLDLPNPAALRAAPAWRLTPWSGKGAGRVFGNQQGFAPPKGQPPRLALAPGAQWSGAVPFFVGDLDPTPDDWALSLLMPVNGEIIESEPCRITIAEWSVAAGAAGWGETRAPMRAGDTLVIQAGPGPRTLCRSPWLEDDSDRNGLDATPAIPLTEVADDAADPVVPTRDAPFWSDPARWWIWREGAAVHAMNSAGQRQRLDLPDVPACLLPTALQHAGGDVTLAALSADRTRLDIIVLPRDGKAAPRVANSVRLPAPAETAALAFAHGDAGLGDMRLVAHVTMEGAARFFLFTIDGGILEEARGPRCAALPNGALAIHAGPDGALFAATLARGEHGLLLIQARFAADHALAAFVTTAELAWPDEALRDTAPEGFGIIHGGEPEDLDAFTQIESPDRPEDEDADLADDEAELSPPYLPPALHGIVDLAGGHLFRLTASRALQPFTVEGRPVRPFVLTPTSEGALVLCAHRTIGPFMCEL